MVQLARYELEAFDFLKADEEPKVTEEHGQIPPWVERTIKHGYDPDGEHNWGGDRSKAVFAVVCTLVRHRSADRQITDVLLNRDNGISAHIYDQSNPQVYAARQIERARQHADDDGGSRIILDPHDPLKSAQVFLDKKYRLADVLTLRRYAGSYYTWKVSHYDRVTEESVRGELYDFLSQARQRTASGIKAFKPDRAKTENILHALAPLVLIPSPLTPPCMLDGIAQIECPFIALQNTILELTNDGPVRRDHSPSYFNLSASDFDYDATAPDPANWHEFLKSLWPEDQPAIDTLQEIFGTIVACDRRHQKIFMCVGPPRSGKGTIGGILKRLLGARSCASPTISSLQHNFGLQPLIDKGLALISDARLSGSKSVEALERMLAISGGDDVTVDIKHKEQWTGLLRVQFFIMTNEIPEIKDNSGAFPSRFIILQMENSFLGAEDLTLGENLCLELPGILNWAISGFYRVRERGYFIEPESSSEARGMLSSLSSPLKDFIDEYCELRSDSRVSTRDLYEKYVAFRIGSGIDDPVSQAIFGKELFAACPKIRSHNLRTGAGGARARFYAGIGFRDTRASEIPDSDNELQF